MSFFSEMGEEEQSNVTTRSTDKTASRRSSGDDDGQDASRRLVCHPPEKYVRQADVIPFHIPHRKLLEKYEYKKTPPEPLTGFKEAQLKLIRRRRDSDESISKRLRINTSDSSFFKRKVEGDIVLPHHRVPNVVKQQLLINQLRNDTTGNFVYLVYAVPRSSEHYTPYALIEVPYEKINKKNFLTMSHHGVLQHRMGEQTFTSLDKWEAEYKMYCRLMRIKSLFYFRYWKAFYVWRKNVLFMKYEKAKKNVNNDLFILNQHLREALLKIQSMIYFMENDSYVDDIVLELPRPLFYFIEDQMIQMETLQAKLNDFRMVTKEILVNACTGALLAKGFVIDETKDLKDKKSNRKQKISYIEQANKKNYCIRLNSFVILADYMRIIMLHKLMNNTTKAMLKIFKEHIDFTPKLEALQTLETDKELKVDRPEHAPQEPLFPLDLLVTPNDLTLDPPLIVTKSIFKQLTTLWYELSVSMKSFITDTIFRPFTNPMINGKIEDRLCGNGPPLYFYLEEDHKLQELTDEIFTIIEDAYVAVNVYKQRFESVREFYAEDYQMEATTIENETELVAFRNWCTRYNDELEFIDDIISTQPLGLTQLSMVKFKKRIRPQPVRLLEVLKRILPAIGKTKIDQLISGAEETEKYLSTEPTTTVDFVNFIEYIESASSKVDDMENVLEYCKELYDMMEEYKIPIPDIDMNNYLSVSVTLGNLRNFVDKKVEEKINYIKKLAERLFKDISELINEIGTIRDECSQPWLYDINSSMEAVMAFLDGLYAHLQACQAKAAEYRNYQKQFRLEVTRLDILDEVIAEVKLKMLLWESADNWAKTVQEWYSCDFSELNPEDMQLFTAKTMKNVTQLEKGIPKNLIVPKLRDEVELMKDKLPIIQYLRNTALRNRHWLKIENVLNYKFKPDEVMTLSLLEELKVFNYPDEIMDISGQASSEYSLELLLKKVEEMWSELEYIVLPHKDSKDVFILGTLEDIQAALDESNINIATILSSRHVGPIKPRVEEWAKMLDQFSRTMDEWVTCQQQWMYLEIIFSAPDIQRQLPSEAKMFLIVDKNWKDIMRRTHKVPLAMEATLFPGLLETLQKNNALLEQIMKCLESYLETKRVAFPRFYFLSNDELLDILAQTRNPFAVQPHLRKCFDAIAKLEFGMKEEEGQTVMTTDIVAMISPEGERVQLSKGLKARGNVEDWLGKVEESMFLSLKKRMKSAIRDYTQRSRESWVVDHPNQIILTVSQIMWAKDVHEILDKGTKKLEEMAAFEEKCVRDLNNLAGVIRGNLSDVTRKVLIALITIDVHARDTISNMVKNQVVDSNNFEWLKMLRYYWDFKLEFCVAKMSSTSYNYKYEYLGAGGVLVITPLTDKCYLCLMGALQLDLGGAPAGPAGTGKTETTKDLAKAMAVQCVVFNCSEGLDYKMMGRFFSGLAQSGAWCCFDEFNRIDIEVLSVIAQQLITIRNAKAARAQRFMFEGREIKLVMTCAAFITMNPGYAGRTELPDNLKALFRPISMMVPDYALIAEVVLYSEGFESSKLLSHKMVQMYKLCSEQLSQQDHYDFGMRAVKSVLVMAGALKRANPDKSEDVVLICALRDSNLPKFLAEDAILFKGILNDLFPGVELPEQDYGLFQSTIVTVMEEQILQPESCMIKKVIQLYETMIVRWGVMLVGPTGGGKSTILNTLNRSLTKMYDDGVDDKYYRPVRTYIMNPKAVTAGELYGEVNPFTMEWRDGLMGIMVRTAVNANNDDHQWVICDGPVDAVWIENLNTVLDDNKMLCLANSERIKLTPYVHMVFEVMDLAQASPATVSRCGMVYVDSEEIKYLPYVRSWLQRFDENLLIPEMKEFMLTLFETYIEDGFNFVKKRGIFAINQVDISKVVMCCSIINSILHLPGAMEKIGEKSKVRNFLCQTFVYAYMWGIGGNLTDVTREKFELFVREQFEEHPDARLPTSHDLWSMYINITKHRLAPFAKIMPVFNYTNEVPFFNLLVPTLDTLRFGTVMELLLKVNHPVIFTGDTGVGKSVIAKDVLNKMQESGLFVPVTLNFSAQTSSFRTQEILELKLEKRKKTLLGAPIGKRVIIFVDDINMPKLETYGAQPPIELLRQLLDYHGLYDREKLFWKDIQDVVLAAACAPPGGGRNPLTPRFVRHFGMMLIPPPNEAALKQIFKSIMKGFLDDFSQQVMELGEPMVNAAVEIYQRIEEDLLPTPAKSHYVFNLRDLSKCIQGVLQADSGTMREPVNMQRLFYYECLRVFHDRLINEEDKSYFYYLMKEVCLRYFSTAVLTLPDSGIIKNPPLLLFGDFMVPSAEFRIYEEIRDIEKLKSILQDYLDDFNLVYAKDMKLIFFMDAIEHCTRIARILRAERGNALLVGLGGMGKQSLTKLASHVNGYKCSQIELTRNYDHSSFFEDLRKMYFNAGCNNQDTVFLFTDNQIVQEEFLEDINNILNSGEVPNLFETDEYEKVIIASRPHAKEAGVAESNRDGIYEFFISRVRSKLHLVICMSPVGDAFRRRCRMFPSLVNCCTIDWFLKWPKDALLSVAENSLKEFDELSKDLAKICVTIHASVETTTERFYEEMRRHYYTTPSNYLEILKLYKAMLETKKQDINKRIARVANGLTKLYETNSVIDTMKATLQAMEPQLAKKSAAVAELMKNLAAETKEADKVRSIVKKDEDEAKAKADECQALADDAQKDLDVVMPAMDAASKALEALNKNDINEIRVFQKPPELVKFVIEPVCLLLGSKTDWQSAKVMMGDTNFLKKLQEYDKDHIPENTLKKLKDYIENKNFVPEIVAKVSKVCKSICQWVRAIDTYAKVFKVVAPKKQKVEEAEKELNQVMTLLREKQRKLAEVEAVIGNLEAKFNTSMQEKQVLEDDMALTSARLTRAARLNIALGDEQTRWEQIIEDANVELGNLIGDVLIAAASVAYLGAFTSSYRAELVDLWLKECRDYKIPSSETYSLIEVLADPYDIRMWNTCGLPRDSVSTENAIIVTKAGRWPLMIDPQEQANRWIKAMETPFGLKMIKLTDSNFMRILESAIRIGIPVLLEEVGETLDPVLAPILLKQTFIQGGRTLIHLGDSDIEYDDNFRFYITTKLSNPHYLPEICIQATIVNFTVTPSGLEDQLLVDVVRLERPDLEKQRTELIIRINTDKQSLKNIEDKILKLLYQSEGNILDDEELIDTLNESKETSAIIASRLIETEATEEKISVAREKYRSVATRGSVLYFVVAQLSEIDPMYQYSLKYFNQIFNVVIETSEKSDDLPTRLNILYKEITLAVYTNVSRGLFERHKLVYSFMLCVAILINANVIQTVEYNYLLRGAVGTKPDEMKKLDDPAITDLMWTGTIYLRKNFEHFKDIQDDILNVVNVTIGDYVQEIKPVPHAKLQSKTNWDELLTDFEKLMLIKTFQEEKLVFAITAFVKYKLGQPFIESPLVSLNLLYQDTSNITPLIFILSTGSDPFGAFQRFASDMGFKDKILSISLGQGQGPVAEKLLEIGKTTGQWVFLQNCHLATSWMLPMERIVQAIAEDASKIHPSFRLYLSSMPSKSFPVSVLQNSVKVTNEPPKGVRANIKRAFTDMLEDFFEDHPLEQDWRTMLFGICMFHAIIQERKKFGPLGWNITYEFNDSDREFAFNTLKMFCAEGYIPWDALEYITGEITYGGRVTDYWDLRCLKTILKIFFSPQTLVEDWKYSHSGIYYCPRFEKLVEYRNFIEQLPIIEQPEIFGMHDNANIAFQNKETQNIILTILDSQPRVGGGTAEKSADEIVYELSQMVVQKIMKNITTDEAFPTLFNRDDKGRYMSLTTVLTQEIDRYNKLLKLLHISMLNLQKAIKGLVVMSEDLEEVFKSFLNNQVPKMWSSKSYPSLKSLGSWIHDLELRLDFIVVWLKCGHPTSYWISGFYFPQGFITGTLQTHARKYNLPIDQLKFDFFVKSIIIDQENVKIAHDIAESNEDYSVYSPLISPEDGVIVHGLYGDAGRWDLRTMKLVDPLPGEINPPVPAILFLPVTRMPENDPRYVAPLYKTSVRAGVLSTTGHSTNFVLSVLLPSNEPQSYWILKGTALLTQLTN